MLFWKYGTGREGQFYVYSTFLPIWKPKFTIKGLKSIEAYEKCPLRTYL